MGKKKQQNPKSKKINHAIRILLESKRSPNKMKQSLYKKKTKTLKKMQRMKIYRNQKRDLASKEKKK